jgi:hypothetical protein
MKIIGKAYLIKLAENPNQLSPYQYNHAVNSVASTLSPLTQRFGVDAVDVGNKVNNSADTAYGKYRDQLSTSDDFKGFRLPNAAGTLSAPLLAPRLK